jgi:hypothetical protein
MGTRKISDLDVRLTGAGCHSQESPLFSRIVSAMIMLTACWLKPLKPPFALEVFEMAADCAFAGELVELLSGDRAVGPQFLRALARNGPALAFGEGLFEERNIRRLDFSRIDLRSAIAFRPDSVIRSRIVFPSFFKLRLKSVRPPPRM